MKSKNFRTQSMSVSDNVKISHENEMSKKNEIWGKQTALLFNLFSFQTPRDLINLMNFGGALMFKLPKNQLFKQYFRASTW